MTEIMNFTHGAFGNLRSFKENDNIYFCAKDVCDALGLENVSKTVARLDEDEKVITATYTLGGDQDSWWVTEPGLYQLVIPARKEGAKAFKRWICHEVLPDIRKRGFHGTDDFVQMMKDDPRRLASMLTEYAEEKELRRIEEQKRILAEMERDHAMATKAEIGTRREATAMATASVAVRKVSRLEDELGEGKTWKRVRAIKWLPDYFILTDAAYQQIGKQLAKLSRELQYQIKEIPDTQYPFVKAYHLDVIEEFQNRLDEDPEYLSRLRRLENQII